jgi:hypothetical protein
MAGFAPAFSRFQGERITKLSHILLSSFYACGREKLENRRTPRQSRTGNIQLLRLTPLPIGLEEQSSQGGTRTHNQHGLQDRALYHLELPESVSGIFLAVLLTREHFAETEGIEPSTVLPDDCFLDSLPPLA